MVISDLQYLESVETSALVGGWKKPQKPSKKGGGKIDLDINVAVVTVNQFAFATKGSIAANNAEVYVFQS